MTDKLLIFTIALSFLVFCCSGSPSQAVNASVEIPSDEIEITFQPFDQVSQPIVNITVPHSEIEIFFLSDK